LDRNRVECVEEVLPSQQNFAEEERYYVNRQNLDTVQIPERKLWRLDSNTEIELDKVHSKKSKLDLDLRIPPRVRPQHTARIQENPETTNQKALQPNLVQDYGYERRRKETCESSSEERQQRRTASTHRYHADKPNKSVLHRSQRSKERSIDMDRSLIDSSERHIRLCKLVEAIELGKTDIRLMMIVMEKIVRIMTIDDEIKTRRDILEEKIILHQVTTMTMDRMIEVRQIKTPLITQKTSTNKTTEV